MSYFGRFKPLTCSPIFIILNLRCLDIDKSLKADNAKRDCYFLLGKAYVGKKDSINACDNFIKSAKLGDKEAREMLKQHCIKKE